MAIALKTPGVYIEEIPRFPPSIAPVETAIPAFIGYTEKAMKDVAGDLTLKPKRIGSIADFEHFFGGPQKETAITLAVTQTNGKVDKVVPSLAENKRSKHILYYALQMFYANGGGPCYIVSVGGYKAVAGDLVEAELAKGIKAVAKEDAPTLIVIPEAQSLTIGDFEALHADALKQCNDLQDRFVIMDVHGDDISLSDPDADLDTAVANFRSKGIGTDYLKYGAAYAPNIDTILDFLADETKTDVTITNNNVAAGAAVKMDTLEKTDNATFQACRAAIRDMPCRLPPSSTIAGIYAAVDTNRGVWKAPANVSVNAVIQPTIQFGNAVQDGMNIDTVAGKSVNAIRPFIGRGTLVWGARTLAGNDNEWRYVSVRRFFIFVEESVRKATGQFVFEPNDANTWVTLQGMIENFLTTQWRQGALQGVKPEHAFYVAVGIGKTMTALDILEGRLNIEIGLAVVRPAEFIVLKFSHMLARS